MIDYLLIFKDESETGTIEYITSICMEYEPNEYKLLKINVDNNLNYSIEEVNLLKEIKNEIELRKSRMSSNFFRLEEMLEVLNGNK